jgi:hypothetical protein
VDHSRDMPVEPPVDTLTYHQGWDEFPELSDREKVVLCVVADICRQTLGMPFESQATMGLTHGVADDALRELSVFQGGYAALQLHLGSAGRRLTPRERIFGALTADVLHGVLDGAFEVHTARALAIGVPPADVRAAIRFCGQFDTVEAWHGLRAAEPLLPPDTGLADPFVA